MTSERDEMQQQIDYRESTDEQLVAFCADGDEKAMDTLFKRYKGFVRNKARPYFIIGADKEDIIQEGMIGLYKAIRDFNTERSSSFRLFAEICVKRQIITAIKTATRQKHIPLNSYLSFNKPVSGEESNKTVFDVLSSGQNSNPEDLLIRREDMDAIARKLERELSGFEWKVVSMYMSGRSYNEIAAELNKTAKSIDNALQRVKRKLEKLV